MKYIGITEEHPIEQENRLITALLDNGLDLIHLRKPKYSGEKTEQLLLSIPPRYYDRISNWRKNTGLPVFISMEGIRITDLCRTTISPPYPALAIPSRN